MDSWRDEYKVNGVIVADAPMIWGAFFDRSATPLNMFIDARTMKILDMSMGFEAAWIQKGFDTYSM